MKEGLKMENDFIYLDNASTSRTRPREVQQQMDYYLNKIGVSPGRSHSKLSRECERRIMETRQIISDMFHLNNKNNVIFTSGATEGLNLILKGLLKEGDHVISTCVDHNSSLRPIINLAKNGIECSIIDNFCCEDSFVNGIKAAIKSNTKLMVITHASNVTGEILPVEKLVSIARNSNILTLLDCAQTAGKLDINVQKLGVDYAVMSGHKALMGPPGIGFVLINNTENDIAPLKLGGTGIQSEVLEPLNIFPNAYEAGTINSLGIYGLYGALTVLTNNEYIEKRNQMYAIYNRLVQELSEIPYVKIYRLGISHNFVPTVTITVDDKSSNDLAEYLETKYDIIVRSGLHCSPLIHKKLNTPSQGTVRISLSTYNSKEDVDILIRALKSINKKEEKKEVQYSDTLTFEHLADICLFCDPQIHGQARQVLLRTKNFYLFSPLGAIIDGNIIITPYSCTNQNSSISEISKENVAEFNKLRDLVKEFYIYRYGHPGLAFEHGRVGTCLIRKNGTKHCYHGHLCCYPGIDNSKLGLPSEPGHYYLWEDISDESMIVDTNGINDLSEKVKVLPYLYFEHYENISGKFVRKSKVVLISNEEKLESQYLRKLLAKRIDDYKLWDWRAYPKVQEAYSLVDEFKAWYAKNKVYFDVE